MLTVSNEGKSAYRVNYCQSSTNNVFDIAIVRFVFYWNRTVRKQCMWVSRRKTRKLERQNTFLPGFGVFTELAFLAFIGLRTHDDLSYLSTFDKRCDNPFCITNLIKCLSVYIMNIKEKVENVKIVSDDFFGNNELI